LNRDAVGERLVSQLPVENGYHTCSIQNVEQTDVWYYDAGGVLDNAYILASVAFTEAGKGKIGVIGGVFEQAVFDAIVLVICGFAV